MKKTMVTVLLIASIFLCSCANKQLPATGWSQGIVYFAQVVASVLVVFFCVMNLLKVIVHSADKKEGSAAQNETENGGESV